MTLLLPLLSTFCFGWAAAPLPVAAAPSRIALKLDNLLIVGNRVSMAVACLVQTPPTDDELRRRRLDPAQWRKRYCAQSLDIIEPWAAEFKKHGNFHLLPREAGQSILQKVRFSPNGEADARSLAALGRKLQATHLLLIQERLSLKGESLGELRVLQLVDLEAGDVLAVDQNRF